MSPQPFNSLPVQLSKTFSGKKVLVTGHTGFKGSWLCEWLLLLGAKVTGFSLEPSTSPSLFRQLKLEGRIDHVIGDIRDAEAVRRVVEKTGPDFVFHLAAQPLVRLSYSEPVETYATNVMGTVHVLEALRVAKEKLNAGTVEGLKSLEGRWPACVAVMVTTDKCYENREWVHAYREEDPMGGYDPYSSSKAAAEIAIAAYRRSFFNPERNSPVRVASARAGNVIGGGDWALDRIVPDCIRALNRGEAIPVRNRTATRPWQHVLEPLGGYLCLAAALARGTEVVGGKQATIRHQPSITELCSAFNFGPELASNRTVAELVEEVLKHVAGKMEDKSDPKAPHEAGKLNLTTDKAFHYLGWRPVWNFERTLKETVSWYGAAEGGDVARLTREQIASYSRDAEALGLEWAETEK